MLTISQKVEDTNPSDSMLETKDEDFFYKSLYFSRAENNLKGPQITFTSKIDFDNKNLSDYITNYCEMTPSEDESLLDGHSHNTTKFKF